MKRKYADYRDKIDILDRKVKVTRINDDYFNGYVTELDILKVRKKWIVDEDRVILDKNYKWLCIFPLNTNYTITVMQDEKENIKEWYIDISYKVGIEDNIPYEDDLYLDIVYVPDGRINILDEDELIDAFNNKLISEEDLKVTYDTAKYILDYYNVDKLYEYTKMVKDILYCK